MKRAKWILAVLTVLALCVIGVTALADGNDPQLSLRVVNGALTQSQYTGSYYYKIYIDNIPEGTKAFEAGFGDATDSAPTDPWLFEVSKLREDNGGLFTMCVPDINEGDTYSETFFVRLHEGQAWQKVTLVYDLTKTNGSAVTISNESGPVLDEDYMITWTGGVNADAYILYWKMPNGHQPEFFIPGEDSSLQLFSLTERYGDVGELTRYAGTYEVWIETYANNQYGVSDHQTWTVTVPTNEDQEIHLTGDGAENGVITVPVYGEVKVNVTADDSVIHNQIEEFHFVNGQWTEDINPWDLWQNGYVQMCWRPNSETPQDFTVYAYARIKGEDGESDRLVRSNALTVRVTVDKAITDEVTYIVDGEADGHPAAEPIDVPKDGTLVLQVNNIGADYYGAEIDEPGVHLDHIAESRWVTPEPGITTEVRLPVFECEVGQEYEVRVYALKIGAAMQYAERRVRVHVVERTTDAPLILEIAKDPDDQGVYHYDTDERIRIYSHYENLDGALDEEFSWIQVRAYNDHKDYCFWDESGDGFYYWTDGMRIGNPGDYLIEAVVMTNADHNWDTEAQEVDGTKVTARIHVEASAEERLAAPAVSVNPFLSTAGVTDVTLNVGAVNHAERYFYWIHPSDGDMDRMNGDLAAAGPVSIDTGLLGPGVYTAVVSAHARGYEENFTTCDFVVFGSGDTDLSTANYYFSTNARPAEKGAATDFIADVGEEIRFIGFIPGSGEINLGRKEAGWTETRGFGYCEAPGMSRQFCFDEGGTYTVYMGGVVNGVWTEYPVCTFEVSSDGSLEAPAVTVNGQAFADQAVIAPDAENPHKLTVAFDKVPGAGHYYVEIREDGEDWIAFEQGVNAEEYDGNTIVLEIENDAIQPGRAYRLYVEASAYGINWNRTEGTFLLAEGQQTAGIFLTVNGSAEPNQTVLSSTNLHVQVTWPEGPDTLGRPTAVRVLNNNRWEYMWNREDDCQRDWGFGDGQMFLYAEATWDTEYDFERLDRNGWRDFDWDRDVDWTGKSNIIKLNVISPYGTMIAPEFSLAKSQLDWGEDLVVTIADEGPSRINPDAQGGRSVVKNGWFFFSIEVECGDHWDRYDEFRMNLHSGVNTIPTYWITPGSRCRIEVGADGEGYSGRSTWREFTVAEREPEAASVKMFRVNGVDGGIDNPGALSVDTMTELYMQAYMDGAEWYNVEITEKDNDDWRENCGECRIGMLTDSWHSCHAGEFTLTAYAYGRRDGREWEELIGTVDVTYNAPNGDLDSLTATMVDRAYAGAPVVLIFNPVENEPEGTEYGYWLHEDTDGQWLMGDTFPQAGSVTIDTDGLEPDVYWVEMDATAPGYNQSHAELHIALLDPDDTEMSGDTYYFTTSMQPPEGENLPDTDFVVPASQDFRFTYYVPGAEAVNLKQKRSDWDDPDGFAGCDGPGISQWHSFDRRGEYTIYGQYRANGRWSDDIALCTVTVTAEDSLARPWVDMPMVVGAGEDVHLTYHIDGNAESYSYWISYEDEGWNVVGEWVNLADLDPEEITDKDTFDLVIPADRLEPNRVYHVYLDINKPGWEQGHDDRLLFVLGEADPDAVTLTVNDREGNVPQAIAIGGRYPVTVNAPGAETLHIWWDESVSFIDLFSDYFEQEFCLDWKGGKDAPDCCTFYAIATYDRNWLKVSPTIEIPISNRATAEEATAPSLTLVNQGTIFRGQFVQANVGEINDEGVYEYCAYITDKYDNWICVNGRGDPGVIALPTNDLEPGKEYKLRAYARVLNKYRTDSEAIEFQVSEPATNLFVADKDTVAVMERLTVSIVAPGADRVRFNSGYDNWDEFDGDSWYSDSISWDMSEDNVTIKAEAWFPGDDDWTPIGDGLPISITASGRLDQPEFIGLPESIDQGQDLSFGVEAVTDAEEYEVQLIRFDGRDELCFRSGSPNFYIPADRLYSGGYRVKVFAMAYGKNAGQNEASLYVKEIRPEIGIDSVVSNTEDLDITVPLVAGGEDYHLMIHYVPNDNFEESILFEADRKADDAQEGILTFTVPAGRLRDNTTHWVDLNVDGHDFYAENAKAFLVRNGSADPKITMSVNGQAGGVFADVKIHENFTVDVSAQGAKAIIIHCGDMWQAYAGNEVSTGFNEYQICSETLYAQAYYGDETNLPDRPWDSRWLDLDWDQPGNPVTVNFYAVGQAGEPWGRFPNIVRKGEILVISDINPGENGNETHANINRNDPGQEEDRVFGDWKGWDEASRAIYLPTDGLEANRDYWIMLDNSGIGMEGNRMWWRVSVFPGDELPAGSVAINSLEKVQTGMEVPVSVSAPGAVEVGFGLDLTDTEKADAANYQFRGDENADSYFTRDDWLRIDDPGVYTLTAYAVFPGSNEVVHTDKTITVCEPLRFDMTEMPGFFTEGQDEAAVTVKLPANAQRMSIQVYVEDGNNWHTVYESRDRDETDDTTIQIPAQKLIAGSHVVVDFQARADGFMDVGERIDIPVTLGTQSSQVTLRLVDNREDQNALNLNDIWANQRMVFLATPTAGNEITAIRFFNGHGWWEDGDAITRDSHEDWFMNDGSVFFEESYNDDDNRTITAFAEVLVNGGETWQRTNEIRFTVQNHGTVGEYDFVDDSDIIVPRGTVVTVEFEEAAGATHYWIDAFDEDRGWDPRHSSDGTTVWFNTNRLPAGTYELRGRAGGSDESGLMWRESTGYVKLIITDDIPQMAEATFTTPRGLTIIEDEAFAGIAARVVVITRDVESVGENAFGGSLVEQIVFLNADTEIHWNAFGGHDNLTVYGIPGGKVESWAEDHFYNFYPLPMQE